MNDVVGVRYVSDTCHSFFIGFYFKISNLCVYAIFEIFHYAVLKIGQ